MADNLWDQGETLSREEEDALFEGDAFQPEIEQPTEQVDEEYVAPKLQQVEFAPQAPRYQFERGPVKPKVGVMESQARGFAGGASFGLYDELYGSAKALATGEDVGEEVAYQQYMNKAAAEQNPYAYGAGQFAGAASLTAIPGIGIPAGTTALGRAGLSALQSGIAGYGEGENMPERIEKGIQGLGLGGALGGLAEPAVRAIAKKVIPTPTSLRTKASERAVKSAIATQGKAAREVLPDYVEMGQRLLNPTEELGGEAVVRFGKKASDVAERAATAAEQVGDKMGIAIQAVDNYFPQSWPMRLDRLNQNLTRMKNEILRLPKAKGVVGSADEKFIEDIRQQLDMVQSLDDLSRIRTKLVFDPTFDTRTLKGTKAAVRNAINQEIKDSIESAAPYMGQGLEKERALMLQYPELVAKYRAFKPTETYGHELAVREFKNRDLGLTSNIAGAAVGGAALQAGQPIQIAGLKAIAVAMANQLGLERGNTAAAVSMQKLANVMDKAPAALQKFYPMLMEASKRGATSLAITHQALMNQNPEYRRIVEQQP